MPAYDVQIAGRHLPIRSDRFRRIVRLAATLGLILGLFSLLFHLATDPFVDVRAYYDAGARLNAGSPLYVQPAGLDEAAFYRYPPLLAILFRPLALLPFEQAVVIWEGILLIALGLTVRRLGQTRTGRIAMAILALPFGWALAIGQAEILVTALLTLGSPAAAALAGQLKVLPALVTVYWLGRADWRSLARFVGISLGLLAAQWLIAPADTVAYLSFLGLDQVGAVRNLSPYAISPVLWGILALGGAGLVLRLAPGRRGWAASVAFAVLVSPRLLLYQFATLAAGAAGPPDRPRRMD